MADVSFGEWLKRQRKATGLTQEQLANQVGCSAIAIRKIEAAERRPSAQIVERLALIFHISKNEQKDFLRFARSESDFSLSAIGKDKPWQNLRRSESSNLPAQLNSFVGREREMMDVHAYLQKEDTRLVTLVGPPGIGKTRLSLEAARASLADFADGIFFIPLAALDDPSLIPLTILQALDYVETGEPSPVKQLSKGIGSKRILLVLDNCEHLIDDVALLASELLSACSRLTILATSRESLRIPGEWLYSIPTLGVPKDNLSIHIETAANFPALTLFAERARAVRADFALSAENVQAVASICVQLDGLPLAIELIATRIRLMSAQSLLKNLTDTFILSADGMRAVSARQKTLNNAIGWTYNLLPVDEQKLFDYLAVLSGGFSLHAAEAIVSGIFAEKSVMDLVMSLSDKSMLQRELDENGEVRFSMLVTLQQFALGRLRASGSEAQVRDEHLAHFVKLSERENVEIRGPGQVESARRIQREHDNLRAALEWSISSQKTESALRLLSALGWHWEIQGHYREARNWLDRIRAMPNVLQYPVLYARILNHIGRYYWTQDAFDEAREMLEESERLSLQLGSQGEICLAEASNWLGLLVTFYDQDLERARFLFERGLELYERHGEPWGTALSTFHLGLLEDKLNHADRAFSLLQSGLAMFQQLGDQFFISRTSLFLGYLYLDREDYEKTRYYFEEHMRIDTELQFWDGIAEGWRDLGALYKKQGDLQKAEDCLERSRQVCDDHGLFKVRL